MIKRTATVFLIFAFCAVAFSMNAQAVNWPPENGMSEGMLMKQDLETPEQTGHLSDISLKTGELIDALFQVLNDGDPESLQPVIEDCAASIDLIREQQLVEECRDALLSGLFYSGRSLLETITGGGNQACLTLSAGSTIADIVSVLQSYQICAIDNSEVPDWTLRQIICQQQKLVKTYDFLVNWIYVTQCTYDPAFVTYLTLIINFISVFTVCS